MRIEEVGFFFLLKALSRLIFFKEPHEVDASDPVFILKRNIHPLFPYIRSETVPHFHNNTIPNSGELYLDLEGDSHKIFNSF